MTITRQDVMSSLRLAGDVERYHTWPTLTKQTNASHTWNCIRIYLLIWGTISPEVAKYLMVHDVGELHTGDLPYPIKARNPALKSEVDRLEAEAREVLGVRLPSLSEDEKIRVRFVDLADMCEFGIHELALGNRFALPIVTATREALYDLKAAAQRPYEQLRMDEYLSWLQEWRRKVVYN